MSKDHGRSRFIGQTGCNAGVGVTCELEWRR